MTNCSFARRTLLHGVPKHPPNNTRSLVTTQLNAFGTHNIQWTGRWVGTTANVHTYVKKKYLALAGNWTMVPPVFIPQPGHYTGLSQLPLLSSYIFSEFILPFSVCSSRAHFILYRYSAEFKYQGTVSTPLQCQFDQIQVQLSKQANSYYICIKVSTACMVFFKPWPLYPQNKNPQYTLNRWE
jgi:hypothetical protein